jgi:cell pole-organizing protein PopZ
MAMAEVNSEPTMEEILSSIKKIIAEDTGKAPASLVARRSSEIETAREHLVSIPISNVVPEVRVDDAVDPAPEIRLEPPTPENDDDVLELTEMAVEDTSIAPVADVPAPAAPSEAAPVEAAPTISSPVAVAASRSAFESLSSLIVKPEVHGGDTLEGMVREMLKPMMKEWLDARLPEIVEAMVAKEISRISGR